MKRIFAIEDTETFGDMLTMKPVEDKAGKPLIEMKIIEISGDKAILTEAVFCLNEKGLLWIKDAIQWFQMNVYKS
jgi:hypothetical protein